VFIDAEHGHDDLEEADPMMMAITAADRDNSGDGDE
jgi:hypothetical protein